jgi:hypothetical protein
MGLLAPWFLAGLGLLGLPVYLHLLKRRRSETRQFSSLMFFEQSTQADLKHRRLDYLLLLAARLALLTLIVLAFAQPFLWRAGAAGTQGARLAVIDTSASMGFGGRLERARSEAARLVRQGARLAAFDSHLRLLAAADLPRLEATGSMSSFGELARALRAYQENLKRPLEVHLFSDLQRSSMSAGFSDLRLGSSTRLVLHPLSEKAEPNWTVESVSAPPRVRDGRAARIQATLAGFHTPAARKTVSLEVNGKTVASQTVEVPAEGRAKVEFAGPDIPYGFARCAVAVEGGDGLPADDRYLFPIERTDPRRVWFAGSARAELYFRNALEAATGGAYVLGRDVQPRDASFFVLADAVVDEAALEEQIRRGGSAFVALGPNNAAAGRVPFTGRKIVGTRFASRDGERFLSLGFADPAYPPLQKASLWEGVRFYQVMQVDAGPARVYARLADSTPVLFEQKVGQGTVAVLASPLDGLTCDLPLAPSFVPFVEQIAHRLSGWQEAALAVAVDTPLDLSTAGSSMAVEALDPSGRRALSLEESAKGKPLVVDRAGFWQVRRGAGRNQMIAANIDRRESDLEPMPRESAELWGGGDSKAGGPAAAGGEVARRPLAVWFLAAALMAAAVETFIASNHLTQEAA